MCTSPAALEMEDLSDEGSVKKRRRVFDDDEQEKIKLEKHLRDIEEERQAEEEYSGKKRSGKSSKIAQLRAEWRRERGKTEKQEKLSGQLLDLT